MAEKSNLKVTNLCIRWNTTGIITDGSRNVNIANVSFFTKAGEIFHLPFSNIFGCWIKLNGFYSINLRKKVSMDRDEVFMVRAKDKGFYDIYIPFEAAGGRVLDEETVNFGNYDYTYRPYLVNGENLIKFSDGGVDVSQIDENTLKVYSYISHAPTEEYKKLCKFSYEIEKACGVSVDTYVLKSILKEYDIVKRKK